jgi:hypothetical protein
MTVAQRLALNIDDNKTSTGTNELPPRTLREELLMFINMGVCHHWGKSRGKGKVVLCNLGNLKA